MPPIIVFIESPPRMRIEDGLAYMEFSSGKANFQYVMSTGNFDRTNLLGMEVLAKWRVSEMDETERQPPDAVPIRGKRK